MLFVIAGIFVLLGASIAGGFALMKHEYSDRTQILKSESASAMKALVVYQPSITSASSDVAHAIAEGLNHAGFEVTLNTPGKHLSADISGYSVIVFGSPNYGGSPCEPLMDYMKRLEGLTDKRVLLFSTSGSAEGRLEFDKLETLLHGIKPYKIAKYQASEGEQNKVAAYQLGIEAAAQ